ncbi:iron-containing alcohol dehydrogenase [Clostridium butyricum]|uniref:iron-containing alcohol dehydrogenase n=1 Tax=Clostridium butyricum TaxID=1492 RepID=UPI003F91FA10
MRQLKIEPVIYEYDGCRDFFKVFRIGKDDLIISNQKLYDEYLKYHIKESAVILIDNYGKGYPTDNIVESIYESVKKITYERVIAIGGNSILEIGKIFSLKNISPVNKLFNHKLDIVKEKELVLVQTTCGTGSEITNICTLKFQKEKRKKELNADELYADSAVLIPELLKSLPLNIFLENSINAFINAVDSYISPKATEYTQLFSERAIKIFLNGYKKIILDEEDCINLLFRDFLFASNYAGISLGNTGYGIIHSFGKNLSLNNKLTIKESNYIIFTTVLRRYAKKLANTEKLNRILSTLLNCNENKIYDELDNILNKIFYRKRLGEFGIDRNQLNDIIRNMIELQNKDKCLKDFLLSEDEIYDLYESVY